MHRYGVENNWYCCGTSHDDKGVEKGGAGEGGSGQLKPL